jgi:ABC-type branched-subunit amino acid transport system ATPase component
LNQLHIVTPRAVSLAEEERDGLLDVEGVEVRYAGTVQALRGVDLHVGAGEIVAVLGSNGAGKTTLLRAISGTLGRHKARVDAGRIVFEGERLAGMNPAEIVGLGIVHVPEGRRIFGRLTVDENLRAGGMSVRSRVARTAARQRVLDLFPILAQRRDQRAVLLSGGEQQMLAIGRALMSGPQLLLLDEPSLGLAPKMIGRIGEVVTEINRQGTSVVLVEQNASMALHVARTAYVLELGRVSLSGPAAELAASDEVVRLYLAHDAAGTEAPAGDVPVTASGGPAPRRLAPWVPPPPGRLRSLGRRRRRDHGIAATPEAQVPGSPAGGRR